MGTRGAACVGGDRPLRRDAELNRQKVLSAAAEVFAARGLDVTLDDIADQAGVGVGTVYRRFPNKGLLIEALFEHKIKLLTEMAEEAAAKPDAWEGLIEFVGKAAARQAEDRGLRQVLHNSAYGNQRVAGARSQLTGPISTMIDNAKAQGKLRQDFQITDVPCILVMVSSLAEYTACADPAVWHRYFEFVVDGLRERPGRSDISVPALTEAQMVCVMGQAMSAAR